MNLPQLLLCTDMDRTVVPNGFQPENPDARKLFSQFCSVAGVTLAYVTGRHIELVKDAIYNYTLPEPSYVISDVGTKIYQMVENKWLEMPEWRVEIEKDWKGKTPEDIKQVLAPISELILQESRKQNTHKLSYYLPLYIDNQAIIRRMESALAEVDIDVSIIWSLDEPKNTGLIDVLPRHATKLHAIEFLQKKLKYAHEEVIFAGDSGNDLPVLTSQINAVLVANASNDIKVEAQQLALENSNSQALYIANSTDFNIDGNYSAGVLQGVWHYAPQFRDMLNIKEK
ncbi:MAG: HAD-IIB family hydrolase [Pseudomonadota bacterium]|nr:HAD-IIB family hydrolase [Pseudomonadota bacterium]MDO7711282.1 HAD-IIB family hydrolase [Pseudomonadota bacterium]